MHETTRDVPVRVFVKGVLAIAGTLLLLYFLYQIRSVLVLLFIAAFLAIALAPLVGILSRGKIPRVLAIALTYLLLGGVFAGIGFMLVPPVADGVNTFVEESPRYIQQINDSKLLDEYNQRYDIAERLQSQAETLPQRLTGAAGVLQSLAFGTVSTIFQLVAILIFAFFLLLEGGRMSRFCIGQMRRDLQPRAQLIFRDVARAVGGYVAGALAISLLAGVSTFIVLNIIGVPFSVPLAVLMSLMALIPLVGSSIAGTVIALVCAFNGFPNDLIVWGVFFIAYQQIENNLLQPMVYKRTVSLHPLLVLLSVMIGGTLMGILGALLAIPVAASIQVVIKDWWASKPKAAAESPLAELGPKPEEVVAHEKADQEIAGADQGDEADLTSPARVHDHDNTSE